MEGNLQRSDADGIPIGKPDRRRDALAPAKRAVLAAEILEHSAFIRHDEARMTARHRRCVEPDSDIRIASDDVFADRQWKAPLAPFEPAQGPIRSCVTGGRQRGGVSTKGVTESMRGPNKNGRAGPIAERLAN